MIFQKELIESLKSNSKRIAIESGNRIISFEELLQTANKITRFLLKENLQKETMVGIQLDNRIDFISSMIGIMNARCMFVPINAGLPVVRINSIIKHLNLQYIITSKKGNILGQLESPTNIRKYFFEDVLEGEKEYTDHSYPEFDPNDGIYIYFTSGTTGEPKGIVGRNCSLLQFIKWQIKTFEIDQTCRVSQFISPYFDAFLRDVFVPLMAGGTICIPPGEQDLYSHEKMVKWIDEKDINLIHCVPSLFRVINQDTLTQDNFRNLKYILLSGEKIIPSELVNWYNTFENRVQLVNFYGATESTMIRSYYPIKPEDAYRPKIPIGKPIDDTELLVSNKDLKPCNRLVTGDLYIVSKYVSKGYFGSPELTKEKFLNITTDGLGEAIAYKTGDKARLLANGEIDLLGREDRQVKLRGIRVELDEIEYIISQFDSVKNVAVVVDTDGAGNDLLLAFVQKNDATGSKDFKSRIQGLLIENVPEHMVPAQVTVIASFPLLANGKIDYAALLKMRETNQIVAPVNEIERGLLSIWKTILGDKPISTTDSFQSLGGNSLSIMRLIGQIYNEYNVRVPLSLIFENLTIRRQSLLVEKLNKDKSLTIKKAETKPSYAVSSAQERIYYNYELNKQGTTFNIPLAWKIKGHLDEKKMKRVMRALVDRHESLRTKFVNVEGRLRQVILDSNNFSMERLSVQKEYLDKAIVDFIKPFDLSQAPLLRCGIITTEADEKAIVFDIHHIVCDGISQTILFSDFLKLYNGEDLETLELQYKDFAEWENNFKKTDDYMEYREFWLNNFDDDLPKLDFPTTALTPIKPIDQGGHVKFLIEKDKLQPILDHLEREEITLFSGIYSIFLIFLSKLTGQEDIVLGINTSGRIQAELGKIIGMFAKTLPIRYRLDMGMDFATLVRKIQDRLIKSISNQVYDLTDITNALRKSKDLEPDSLIQAMFVFRDFGMEEIKTNDVTFEAYNVDYNTSKYPISLFVTEDVNTLNCRIEYSSAHFNRNDVELLIKQYKSLIEIIGQNLNTRIIDLLSDDSSLPFEIDEDITFNF